MTQLFTRLRSLPRWIEPVACWLLVAIIAGLCAQAFSANANRGLAGSTASRPFAQPRPVGTSPHLNTSVDVAVPYSKARTQVLRVTPISVEQGSFGDFNLANPEQVRDQKVYYITYTVSYVSGDVIAGPPNSRLQINTGKPALLPPNGLKNWNKSRCQPPKLARNFHMGVGTTLTTCDISIVPASAKVTMIQLNNTTTRWPINS